MAGKERHMYPGNNTPEGFFSYYQYILSQREADKIICIKGGPGVGKSTFMKKIGNKLLHDGYDVDFMHCSSDENSLDGIVLRNKKIALVDGTSPHIVDPIHPGAVDSIIHLGDFWNEDGIRRNKDAVMTCNDKIRNYFARAYNYLAAAGKMYDNLNSIYKSAIKNEEVYKFSARIIGEELAHKEISPDQGDVKKYFASAITPNGCMHYLNSLIAGYDRIYLIKAPVGVSSERMLDLFMESALYRGFKVEGYYCPIKPATKLEHLLIPELNVAFVTSNDYHQIDENLISGEVIIIDLSKIINYENIQYQKEILNDSRIKMDELLQKAIFCLTQAKREHDILEGYYIPNMDFGKIEKLREDLTEIISNR